MGVLPHHHPRFYLVCSSNHILSSRKHGKLYSVAHCICHHTKKDAITGIFAYDQSDGLVLESADFPHQSLTRAFFLPLPPPRAPIPQMDPPPVPPHTGMSLQRVYFSRVLIRRQQRTTRRALWLTARTCSSLHNKPLNFKPRRNPPHDLCTTLTLTYGASSCHTPRPAFQRSISNVGSARTSSDAAPRTKKGTTSR